MEPYFSLHAARRCVRRKIDGRNVLAVAKDALNGGFAGVGKRVRVQRDDVAVVLAGAKIVTVYRIGQNKPRMKRAKQLRKRRRRRTAR